MEKNKVTPAQIRTTKITSYVFLGIGLAMFVFGIFFLIDANESAGWPEVEGSVRYTAVKQDRARGAQGGSKYTIRYYYTVSYRYTVNGQPLSGDRYSMGDGPRASGYFKTRQEAEAEGDIVYPVGSAITVYYNPENPESTVLRPGTNWGTYVPLILGLFFAGCGVFFLKVMASAERKMAEAG